MKKEKIAFTLIEIMVSMLISSIIIIVGFQALTASTIGKAKLIESTNIEKETFFFTQKLFEEIKKGGILDYEEYFNRKVVGNTSFSSGHFSIPTGFGNFGSGGNVGSTTYGDLFYSCRSGDGIRNQMGTGGCATNNFNTYGASVSLKPQRYGEYSFQFIDYNSNFDSDLGDDDSVNGIIGDDDDEYIGIGPEVFSGSTDVKELYLISADKKKRTIFRWNLEIDPNKPSSATCNMIATGTFTGTGCIGKIEYLKLDGKDRGMDHTFGSTDINGTQYDGVIDTWFINPDFAGGAEIVAGTNSTNYRLPLFPDTINVADFQIFAYPNKDIKLSFKDNLSNVAPYIRLKMKLTPSRKAKKKIKGIVPEFEINTTVSLTDIYSR